YTETSYARAKTDLGQILNDDNLGACVRGLGVLDAARLAVLAPDLVRLAQAPPRHAREQVMLHLKVEATHESGHEPAAGYVSAGEHLATKEVDLAVLRQKRHADVVRREGGAHVQTKD